jgi:hypothetical protein
MQKLQQKGLGLKGTCEDIFSNRQTLIQHLLKLSFTISLRTIIEAIEGINIAPARVACAIIDTLPIREKPFSHKTSDTVITW